LSAAVRSSIDATVTKTLDGVVKTLESHGTGVQDRARRDQTKD
jgi:hypothetical protein